MSASCLPLLKVVATFVSPFLLVLTSFDSKDFSKGMQCGHSVILRAIEGLASPFLHCALAVLSLISLSAFAKTFKLYS